MKPLGLGFLLIAVLLSAQTNRTFTGVITDSMCAAGNHSRMRMGSTDAECTIACVDAHGAQFVLYDGRDAYGLSDQRTSEKFAGRRVTITGLLKTGSKTIQVDSITA